MYIFFLWYIPSRQSLCEDLRNLRQYSMNNKETVYRACPRPSWRCCGRWRWRGWGCWRRGRRPGSQRTVGTSPAAPADRSRTCCPAAVSDPGKKNLVTQSLINLNHHQHFVHLCAKRTVSMLSFLSVIYYVISDTLQRNLNLYIPRKGIARPQSQFPH